MTFVFVVAAGFASFLAVDEAGRSLTKRSIPRAPTSLSGALGVAILFTSGSFVLLILAPALFMSGRALLRHERTRRQRAQHLLQRPVVVEVLARQLAIGETVATAIASLDEDQLHAGGLRVTLDRIRSGTSVERALADTPGLLAAALYVAEVSGTGDGAAIERLADRMRSVALDGRAAQAQSGQQLASAAVMTLIPPVVSVLYALSDERAAHFYLHTPGGAAVLLASLTLSGAGWVWMRFITRPGEIR